MVSVPSVAATFPHIFNKERREVNSLYLQLKIPNGARSLPAWTVDTVLDPCSSAAKVLASHTCWCTSRTHPSGKQALKKSQTITLLLCVYILQIGHALHRTYHQPSPPFLISVWRLCGRSGACSVEPF